MQQILFIPVLLFFILFGATASFAQDLPVENQEQEGFASGDVVIVNSSEATVFSAPEEGAKAIATLKKGRRAQVTGAAENGYLPLQTKSGTKAWVQVSDLRLEKKAAKEAGDDLVEPTSRPRKAAPYAAPLAGRAAAAPREREERSSSPLGIERVTFDLGGSAGSIGGKAYTELGLGVNLYFSRFIAWRNALFGRFQTGADALYGLDTSLRAIIALDGTVAGFSSFAGPGYRFANRGDGVPFLEGGVVLKLIGLSFGGGVKVLMNSWTTPGAENDTQYFLILAGGGSL